MPLTAIAILVGKSLALTKARATKVSNQHEYFLLVPMLLLTLRLALFLTISAMMLLQFCLRVPNSLEFLLVQIHFLGCHMDEAVKLVHPDRWWSTQNPHGDPKDCFTGSFLMNVLSLQNRLRRLRLEVAGVFGNVKIWYVFPVSGTVFQ